MRQLHKYYISVLFAVILFAAIIICSFNVQGQTLPGFTMQLTSGKIVDSKSILSYKPLLLVYFSPDCEHCQKLIKEMLAKVNEFKKVHILMVTFFPLKDAVNFEDNYGIKKYSGITVAIEMQPLYLRKYYNLQHTPFTALFSNKGTLLLSYKDETPVNDLAKYIAKM